MNARFPHRTSSRPPSVEEGFLLLLAAAMLTAPLCRVFRVIGERVRERFCDDDDDEVEVASEGEGEEAGEEAGECEAEGGEKV